MLTDDDQVAFPRLCDDEVRLLETLGNRRAVVAGEYLYRQGDASYDFFVLLSGSVEITVGAGEEERVIVRYESGRFLGELNLLTGQRVFLSARVSASGDVLVVPVSALRHVIATQPALSDTILAALLARRSGLLQGAADSIRVIGSRFSPQSSQVREFLTRSRIPHEWFDTDRHGDIDRLLTQFGVSPVELPVVIATGTVLRRATPRALAQFLGLWADVVPDRCFDLVVVGTGPAGLAAAVYGASEGLRTLGMEMVAVGGQAGTSSRIENYLGFPTGITGGELMQRAAVQAEKFGANLPSPCAAIALREEAGHLVVRLSDGTDVGARAVIAATGARYRRLNARGIDEFERRGVYYTATETEARECAPSPVVVAGGGNSAGQAALFLAEFGCAVTMVIRAPDLNASMSRYLVDRVERHPSVQVRVSSKIIAVSGDEVLRAVHTSDDTGIHEVVCSGLFSFIGAEPATEWLSGCAALDDHAFVLTGRSLTDEHLGLRWQTLARRPLPFETSVPGLFAAGDVRSGSTKRVASAVGEGSSAVRSVHQFLAFQH